MNRTLTLAIAALIMLLATLALACGNDAPASSSARSAERTASDSIASQPAETPEPADAPEPDVTSEPASTSSLFALVPTQAAPDSPTETSTPESTATPEPATATPELADTPEPAATTTPSATPEPADTPEPPSATDTATPASVPTNTPTATSIPQPTATATPANTPEPTATSTPQPTTTPLAPTATPTPATPTATPVTLRLTWNLDESAADSEEIARALGKLDIEGYKSEGHIFEVVGQHDHISWQEMNFECGPEIGSAVAPNAESNPTFTDRSNFIWVWTIDDDDYGRCIKLSKYVEWLDIPAPSRDPVNFGTAYEQRATENTESLVYFHQVDDRSYTMPPNDGDADSGIFWQGDTVDAPSAGYSAECTFENNPLAMWTTQRGFVKIPDDDLRRLLGFGDAWFERHSENREAARQAGIFWVINPEDSLDHWRARYLVGDYYSYCWIVPNPNEAPEEPCYICEDHRN